MFGQPHCIVLDDLKDIKTSVMYKNTTGDYYLWADIDNIGVITSTNGIDFVTQPITDTGIGGDYPYNAFTYNNIPYLYYRVGYYLNYLWYNRTAGAWQSGGTGIKIYGYWDYFARYSFGADIKYYDGQYHLVAGKGGNALSHCTSSTPLGTFTCIQTLESGNHWCTGVSDICCTYYMPSLNIFDGKLILTYIDVGRDLHWRVYDGINWIDKGDIEADLGTSSHEIQGHWQSTLKDPVNHQLVCVYINSSGWLVYRVLKNISEGWSDAHIIYKPGEGELIGYPHADYIDRRVVITFASNRRGNYNIYMICAPDYSSISGLNYTYDRIVFPDATPTSTHVNSTVFAIKNINDRPILNITWHVGKIGDIETANNARVWSNMSGTWQSWDVGSDYNTTKINIESVKGSKWMPGETLYWKIEILDIGGVAETLHASDNNIWYWIELE
ncbi:MAG: hypothetical protein DRJ69_00340 [Thermoprotei archaeon]|nr:MAG: hypothetical protein DRJ69_00340 [Thermoprotei archaeon]